MTPDPVPTPEPQHGYGSASWPAGFRGIGGHLIRPPLRAESPPSAAEVTSHGSHLLAPILFGDDESRAALCPVCRARAEVSPGGGWVNVSCDSCGTEFVATDGSPPPRIPPPVLSPIAPTSPLEPLEHRPDRPRGFTSDVRYGSDGHRSVICPQCLGAELAIPRGATVAVVLRCPVCHGPFLVGLGDTSGAAPERLEEDDVSCDPDRRVWDPCPRCGREALTPVRVGRAFVLKCAACGRRVVLSAGPYPPRPPRRPAPPSIWDRVRRWFGGG